MTQTLFHFVRHADHGQVGKVLTGRGPDIALSPMGRAQAATLARTLVGKKLGALFSSPQRRARETAHAIAAETGCPLQVSSDLDEIDFGRWTGCAFETLATDPAWELWNAFRDSAATPGGETMAAVTARLFRLLERLRREFPAEAVCLVSHSDVIKAGLCRYWGKPYQCAHDFEIAPASMSTVAMSSFGATVLAVNERLWLETAQ